MLHSAIRVDASTRTLRIAADKKLSTLFTHFFILNASQALQKPFCVHGVGGQCNKSFMIADMFSQHSPAKQSTVNGSDQDEAEELECLAVLSHQGGA